MSYAYPPTVGSYSPWGLIQAATPLGTDAALVSTASHGGIRVSGPALCEIPQPLKSTAYSEGGWFEEDCDWAIPYLALELHRFEAEPDRGARLREAARRTAWTTTALMRRCSGCRLIRRWRWSSVTRKGAEDRAAAGSRPGHRPGGLGCRGGGGGGLRRAKQD